MHNLDIMIFYPHKNLKLRLFFFEIVAVTHIWKNNKKINFLPGKVKVVLSFSPINQPGSNAAFIYKITIIFI